MSTGRVAAIALLISVLTSGVISFVGHTLSTAEVPDVTRKGQEAAKALADTAGLDLVVVDERASRLVPEGAVIEQHPIGGVRALRGAPVVVVLSLGAEKKEPVIPIQPITPQAAPPPAADAGPPAGKTDGKPDAKKDEPAEVSVPKLYRKRLGQARRLLEEAGLELGPVTRSFNEDLPFGVVFRQSPRPGNTVRKGTQVSVTVNAEGGGSEFE
jgi:serine/threonine-protein kinase